jgi:hypothetical protein
MKICHISSKFHIAATLLLLLSLTLSLCACSTRIQVAKEEPSRWTSHSRIWIVLDDGRQYRVTDPELVDSKLIGHFQPDDRRDVDLAQIESLSIQELDRTKTIGLGVWGLVAVAVLVSLLSGDEATDEPCPT